MDFAENWDKTKARFRGFWNGEIIDRCMAAAVAPRDNARFGDFPFPSDPEGRESWWLDAERVFERQFDRIENTYYAGDAIPSISPDLGVAGHAGYFRGAGYAFGRDAIWFRPFIGGIGQGIGGLVFDRETPLFRKTAEHCKYFCERSKGRVAVAMPKASGNADALAHALGSENLLVAMLEEPEETASALEKMQSAWEAVFAEVNPVLLANNDGGGVIGWLNTWGGGWHGQMQADISVMMSGGLFREFILPELKRQSALMDKPLYHLDGKEQARHLDALLSLERLAAVQWTHVAGQPPPTEFIPELRRIQAAGKKLVIWVGDMRVFQGLLERLSSRGLLLGLYARDENEARSAVRLAERLTHE